MKSTKRILIATVAALLLCATFVTCALAFVAGEDTLPEQYTKSVVILEDNFDNGVIETTRNGLELANVGKWNTTGYMFHANPPTGYVQHEGDLARIQDGLIYGRRGADNVYTAEDESKSEDNLYYNINYAKKTEATHFYYFLTLSSQSDGLGLTTGGLVYEFDINFWHPVTQTAGAETPDDTTDDVWGNYMIQTAGKETPDDTSDDAWEIDVSKTVIPKIDLSIMNTSSSSGGGLISFLVFDQAKERDASGNVVMNGKNPVTKPGWVEIVPYGASSVIQFPANKWEHITIQYDPNGVYRVYVGKDTDEGGRKLLVELSNMSTNGVSSTVKFAAISMGSSNKAKHDGEYALDNLIAYQSASVHDPRLLAGKSETEILQYLASVLADEDALAVRQSNAYEMITNVYLSKYWDGEKFFNTASDSDKAAINYYFFFKENKYDEMLDGLRVENTATFVKYVNQLASVKRSISTINDRRSRIGVIDNFIASVGAAIDRAADEYKAAMDVLSEIRTELLRDENSSILIEQMSGFDKSYSIYAVNAMIEKYELATEAYKNYTEDGVFSGTDATNLKAAVDKYLEATAIIKEVLKDVNSEKFINLVALYADTDEQDWVDDDGTIRRYWYLCRTILIATDEFGNPDYNPEFEGFAKAKAFYDAVSDFFWYILQEEHVAALSEQLNRFNDPSINYIEQAGICAFVNNYVEINYDDIDFDDVRIIELLKENQGYETILGTIYDDYQKSLEQNTEKFVYVMSLVSATTNYKDILPLFAEATALYYSMNINDGAAEAATVEYEKVRIKLLTIELDSTLFISKVAELKEEKDQDRAYALLSECYYYAKNIDLTFDGVTEAKATYDAKMAEQNAATVANAEIAQTAEIACSVRSNDESLDIIKLIKSFLGI